MPPGRAAVVLLSALLLAACRGDLDTARQYAAKVTAWSTPRGLNLLLDITRRVAVRVALAEAHYETAYQAAIAISPPGQFLPHNVEVGEDMLDLVTAATLAGHTEQASIHVAEAVRMRMHDFSPRVAALVLAASAMTAPDVEADELYRSALSHPGIQEFPFDHARILLAQGMWLRRSRRPTEAATTLELAAETFDRLGARPWADRARVELRVAAASVNRPLGKSSELSPQERRIAELAAVGQTAKQIATQLSLSPRTVEAHMSQAFRKLGINRRSALGQALLQPDAQLGPMIDDFAES
jgi:DNA-binding CsgD family transcriptional regulator